jgi:hypothetical protein
MPPRKRTKLKPNDIAKNIASTEESTDMAPFSAQQNGVR